MSLFDIIRKLIFDKTATYKNKIILNGLIVQIFDDNKKIYKYKVSAILDCKSSSNLRYFLAHHITNLKINGIAIDKFIEKKTRRIIVNCSGKLEKFIAGSISQDIIYNSFINY